MVLVHKDSQNLAKPIGQKPRVRKAELPEVRAEKRSGRGAFGQSRCLKLNPHLGAMEACQAQKESMNLGWNRDQRGSPRWLGAYTRPEIGQVMRGSQNMRLGSDWLIRDKKRRGAGGRANWGAIFKVWSSIGLKVQQNPLQFAKPFHSWPHLNPTA